MQVETPPQWLLLRAEWPFTEEDMKLTPLGGRSLTHKPQSEVSLDGPIFPLAL